MTAEGGSSPFVEPERRSSVAAHRHHQPDEPEFLDAAVECDRIITAYRGVADTRDAFNHLTSAWDEGDLDISLDELARLIAVHRELHPDEPWGAYYAARLATDREDYATAESILRAELAVRRRSTSPPSLILIAGRNCAALVPACDCYARSTGRPLVRR